MNIHPSAIVHPKAKLAEDVEIGPFSIIGENVEIGAGTKIMSSVVIDGWTTIGCRNRIYPGVTIGMAPQDNGYKGERAFVRIGDDNEIREYVTIHRAANEDGITTVGSGNLLMAYVHVAHNCTVGNQVTMANYAGMAGHSSIGDQAVIGGLVGIHQFARIGRLCMIGGLAKINKDIPPFTICDGNPARIFGINFRGMSRRGINAEERQHMKKAIRLLCGSGLTVSQAVETITKDLPDIEVIRQLVDFVTHPSRMGIQVRSCGVASRTGGRGGKDEG